MEGDRYTGQKRTGSQRQAFFKKDPAQDHLFEETKRKYTAAICYILAANIQASALYEFLQKDDSAPKIAILKSLRDELVQLRPNARAYLDKPYYLDLQIIKADKQNEIVKLAIGGILFKYDIMVVQTEQELASYLRLLTQILDNKAVWDDPMMDVFKPLVGEPVGQATLTSQSLELAPANSIFQL